MYSLVWLILAIKIFSTDCFEENEDLSKVQYYEKIISENQEKSQEYKFPKDAREYQCDVNNLKDFGSYDFIIVGAGSTGTVLANRLSEIKSFKVLLLEAGSDYASDFARIPSMQSYVETSDYNWQHVSIPQKAACLGMEQSSCTYPRGKGVGGTTIINSLVNSRNNPKDFATWVSRGNPTWSYKEVLPYFIKSEDYHQNDPNTTVYWQYHGKGGELHAEYALPETFIGRKFLQACKEFGYNSTDIDSPWQTGYTFPNFHTKHGRRMDGGTAFVKPIRSRKNLKIQLSSYVTKVKIDSRSKTAEGVHFCHKGTGYFAKATKEVILSSGAFGSPFLLLLSGIGPRRHLRQFKIPLIQDLEVGSTLKDHTKYYGLMFSSNYTEEPRPREEYIKEYLDGRGPYVIAGGVGGILFAQTDVEKTPNYPDAEIILVPPNSTSVLAKRYLGWTNETWNAVYANKDPTKHFVIMASQIRTVSSGQVRLKSSSPFEYPLINSAHLSDPQGRDIEALYQTIQIVLKLVQDSKSFQSINAKLSVTYLPACKRYKYPSKKWWYCAIRQLTSDNYHPFGTCPMGSKPSKGDVVNFELKVHGVKRLRVADASIIPGVLSGHPNPPCVMVGEKLSDMIKKEYGVL